MPLFPFALALSLFGFAQAPPPQPTTPAAFVKAARHFTPAKQHPANQIPAARGRKSETDKKEHEKCMCHLNRVGFLLQVHQDTSGTKSEKYKRKAKADLVLSFHVMIK